MVRLVAMVTVAPEVVDEAVRRARAMLAAEPNVLSGEVGVCDMLHGGVPSAVSYVVTAVFSDRAALERYSTGPIHGEVLDWVRPHMTREFAAVYEIEQAKTSS